MQIFHSPKKLQTYAKNLKGTIGFVPTMGALHEGHIKLIKEAKAQNDYVIVSIFVNPTQFLAGEDFEKYPRKDEADKKICSLFGVDAVFFPQAKDMYFKDEAAIEAPTVRGYILEGASRVGHFSGVLRVVMKLLHIAKPTRAYFGKKDAQQLFLISQMVQSYFLDVEIIAVETKRESDGLALSSRNVYLSAFERKEALKISASLHKATGLIAKGEFDTKRIKEEMLEVLKPLKVEYVAIVSREFEPLERVEIANSIILVEAIVGNTRLLDNIWV